MQQPRPIWARTAATTAINKIFRISINSWSARRKFLFLILYIELRLQASQSATAESSFIALIFVLGTISGNGSRKNFTTVFSKKIGAQV